MKNLSIKTLGILSLFVHVGFVVIGLTNNTNFSWVGYPLIAIGSFAFGTLLVKTKRNGI